MTLSEYLRMLSKTERDALAVEIEHSERYLTTLAFDSKRLASLEIAKKVYASKSNKKLMKEHRFSKTDLSSHRIACFMRKSAKAQE